MVLRYILLIFLVLTSKITIFAQWKSVGQNGVSPSANIIYNHCCFTPNGKCYIVGDDETVLRSLDNGIWEPDESFLNRTLSITGKITVPVNTCDSGSYNLIGIDPGKYIISDNRYSNWKHNVPDSDYYTVQVSRKDTMGDFNFGCYYLWNSINGFVFNDLNENGIFEDDDMGLSNWKLYLKHPLGIDSTTTDLSGYYVFYPITIGKCTIRVSLHAGWEQIYPKLAKPFTYTFYDYDQSISSDFSIHKIPRRTKLQIIYNDNRGAPTIQIWCGTNPKAGAGIWGVSGDYTNADYAEGEFEIPPPLPGGFDIRFVGPPNMSSNFGCGSWTDIRPYLSSAQIDTYYIRFSPESANNGDYPVAFRWSKELVQRSYSGSVVLVDSTGLTTDMKTKDSLIIFNKGIDALLLIAQHPQLPSESIYPDERSIPENYHLEQNYPNPFNPSTQITFFVPKTIDVTIKIYDILGREIAVLINERKQLGEYKVTWNAAGVPSGVYFYRIVAGEFSETKKMTVIR